MSKRARVYVDGQSGTTGLRIREWLAGREDLEVVTLPEARRKDPAARQEMIHGSDVTVLCLPDDAAREAASWVTDGTTRLLDASTAHRVAESWVFGLPELCPGQRDAIRSARRVSNPGCYSSAMILLVRPLVDAGLLPRDAALTVHALSGYSGGGKALIERWEDAGRGLLRLRYEAPYALERVHKHIPETVLHTGLAVEPQFVPAVGPFRCGMRVEIPLHARVLAEGTGAKAVWGAYEERYHGEPFVRVAPFAFPLETNERTFDPEGANDTNRIDLHVVPHPSGHVLLVAILDNLGKGASGVAIQSLNLMLGRPETTGLPA